LTIFRVKVIEHLIELNICEKREQMGAHGLEFVHEYCSAGRGEGVGRGRRHHGLASIECRRGAKEDGSLNEHVETLTTFVISMSVWLPCASIVEDTLV
jgi:hypothetical protein